MQPTGRPDGRRIPIFALLAGNLAVLFALFVLIASLPTGWVRTRPAGSALPLRWPGRPWVAGLLLGLGWGGAADPPRPFTEGRALDGEPFWLLLFDLAASPSSSPVSFSGPGAACRSPRLLHAKECLRRLAGRYR